MYFHLIQRPAVSPAILKEPYIIIYVPRLKVYLGSVLIKCIGNLQTKLYINSFSEAQWEQQTFALKIFVGFMIK